MRSAQRDYLGGKTNNGIDKCLTIFCVRLPFIKLSIKLCFLGTIASILMCSFWHNHSKPASGLLLPKNL